MLEWWASTRGAVLNISSVICASVLTCLGHWGIRYWSSIPCLSIGTVWGNRANVLEYCRMDVLNVDWWGTEVLEAGALGVHR